jgi:hypothetical protein
MKDKFFSYHWDDGFETHKTESEAKERCEELLSLELQDACEGIPDEIQNIFWGRISQQADLFKTGHKVEFEGEMVDAYDVKMKAV